MTDHKEVMTKMALQAWNDNVKRASDTFGAFTDEQMEAEVSPGRNRVSYLLGHLTAVHDRMLPLLGLGERQYAHLDNAYLANADRAVTTDLPSVAQLREMWQQTNATLDKHFSEHPAESWFQRHTSMTDEDHAREPHRNKLSVLMSRTNHIGYHLGQVVLAKK